MWHDLEIKKRWKSIVSHPMFHFCCRSLISFPKKRVLVFFDKESPGRRRRGGGRGGGASLWRWLQLNRRLKPGVARGLLDTLVEKPLKQKRMIRGLDGLLKLRCKNKRSLLGKPCLKVPSQVRAGSVAASSLVHPPSSQVTLPPPVLPFPPSNPLLLTFSSRRSQLPPPFWGTSRHDCPLWHNIKHEQLSMYVEKIANHIFFSKLINFEYSCAVIIFFNGTSKIARIVKAINLLSGRNLNVSLPSFFSESIKIIVITHKDSWRPWCQLWSSYCPKCVQNPNM